MAGGVKRGTFGGHEQVIYEQMKRKRRTNDVFVLLGVEWDS